MEIITDRRWLKIPTQPVQTLEEGEEIARQLFLVLNKEKTGIGLAANQIGINKSVFVINVREPLYFINPEVLETGKSQIIGYPETCLSIPKKICYTARRKTIKISAMNILEPKIFGDLESEENYMLPDEVLKNEKIQECIAIQHEMDHLMGILITDRDIRSNPIKVGKKIGRNERINIQKDKEMLNIKYKYLEKYEKLGWIMV